MGSPIPSRFADMPCISAPTLDLLHAQHFVQATPVQEAVIPLFCSNKDVAVDAATGSGKTLAFVIPVTERLRQVQHVPAPHEVLALIIAPTRELALQIATVAKPFLESVPGCTLATAIGGTDIAEDIGALQAGANCLVGTPGRLDDIIKRISFLSFRAFEVLVLDEADRLLEMGFQKQLDSIMAILPRQRRTGLFSATQTEAVAALVRAGLRNPFRVNVAVDEGVGSHIGQKTPTSLTVQYLVVSFEEKLEQLLAFLKENREEKGIVYFLTCAAVEFMAVALPKLPGGKSMPLLAMHGGMKQPKRLEVLSDFVSCKASALLCTDVAARGLDVPDVNWVLQFDPPQAPGTFVHRCGRTARMGRPGSALALLLPNEDSYAELLRGQGVPLVQREPFAWPLDTLPAACRGLAETDREVMEKGSRAFVSYIRGYKEHHCKFIFQLSELDLAGLARMLGLLRLPVMKEVRKDKRCLESFKPSDVVPDDVPYKDKAREKVRLKALREKKSMPTKTAACSRVARVNQKTRANEKHSTVLDKKLPAAKRQLQQRRQDLDDLDNDYRILQRLKKGKISEDAYEAHVGLDD